MTYNQQIEQQLEEERCYRKKLRSKRIPHYTCPLCSARAEILYSTRWRCADPSCALHTQWVSKDAWLDFHVKMGNDKPKELVVLKKSVDIIAYSKEFGEHVPDVYGNRVAQRKYGTSMGVLVNAQDAINTIQAQDDFITKTLLAPVPIKGASMAWSVMEEYGTLNEQKFRALGVPSNYISIERRKAQTTERKNLTMADLRGVNKGIRKPPPQPVWPEDMWSVRVELITVHDQSDEKQLSFDWKD